MRPRPLGQDTPLGRVVWQDDCRLEPQTLEPHTAVPRGPWTVLRSQSQQDSRWWDAGGRQLLERRLDMCSKQASVVVPFEATGKPESSRVLGGWRRRSFLVLPS